MSGSYIPESPPNYLREIFARLDKINERLAGIERMLGRPEDLKVTELNLPNRKDRR